jgi:endo-alpha-N-acetylgalactosaminidase
VRGGLFVYLSDLTPTNVKQNFPREYTYEVEVWGYKKDSSVTGGKLRLDGRAYDKGLGVHSYCELTYKLGGGFKEFKATIGLDDSVRTLGEPGFGAVVFQVLLDGKPAKELRTGVVKRKGDKATQLRVDVSGAKTLTLVAGLDPTSLHVLGRADWADAHLIRSR